jgi:uncharacterized protein (DUF305 family)
MGPMSRAATDEPVRAGGDGEDATAGGDGPPRRAHEPALDDHSGGGDDDRPDGEGGGGRGGDGDGGGSGPSWLQVAVLVAAVGFLGVAVGLFVGRDDPPGEGSVDVGFYQDMLTHHQQALGVATLEVAYGEDSVLRGYAREVLTFQSQEIGVMRQALIGWGHDPNQRPDEAMAWMGMPVPTGQMPGLLSDEQIDEMREARGADADRLFLQLMSEHHRGGLHMAGEAKDTASDDGVRRLAAIMARTQAQEINEYRMHAQSAGIDVDIPPADVPPAGLPSSSG